MDLVMISFGPWCFIGVRSLFLAGFVRQVTFLPSSYYRSCTQLPLRPAPLEGGLGNAAVWVEALNVGPLSFIIQSDLAHFMMVKRPVCRLPCLMPSEIWSLSPLRYLQINGDFQLTRSLLKEGSVPFSLSKK